MRGNSIRRILVALIIAAPVIFSYIGCKKQAKCGCGKDVLFSLTTTPANVYWETASSIVSYVVGDPYKTYTFCNPSEMYPNLEDAKSGDILLVSGHVYWDCNYVFQSSNSSYYSSPRYYIQVTDLTLDLYGKK